MTNRWSKVEWRSEHTGSTPEHKTHQHTIRTYWIRHGTQR